MVKSALKIVATTVLATATATLTFFGLIELKNRFFPKFGVPRVQADILTPMRQDMEDLSRENPAFGELFRNM